MKNSQLSLFVFLALILSLSFVLFYKYNSYKKIENYKFKSEYYLKDYYKKLIKINYFKTLDFLVESTRFNYFTSFCHYDKDFLFFGAKKIEENERKTTPWFINNTNLEKTIKDCLEKQDFNFSTLNFYKNVILNSSFYFDDYSNLILPSKEFYNESFLVVKNGSIFEVTCYYKYFISFNKLFVPNLIEKSVYLIELPIYDCRYEEKNKITEEDSRYKTIIYLDNLEFFKILDFYSLSFEIKNNDDFKEELLHLINSNPEIKESLLLKGKVKINDYVYSLSIHSFPRFEVKLNGKNLIIYVPSKDFLILEEKNKTWLISYFIRYS